MMEPNSSRKLKIKVCGMKYPDNIALLTRLQPDYMGFIRYPRSPRYTGDRPADLLAAATVHKITNDETSGIRYTGVYVDASMTDVIRDQKTGGLGAVQLHGSESAEYCEKLRHHWINQDGTGHGNAGHHEVMIIRSFGLSESFDWKVLGEYEGLVDLFLFDTKSPSYGGTGKKFDWNLLSGYPLDIPYFLSGGIGPEDIDEIMGMQDHRLYGVDLNSRYETHPGKKDIDLLKETIIKLRNE